MGAPEESAKTGGPPPPFASALWGLPVVATATFLSGECKHIIEEGRTSTVAFPSSSAADKLSTANDAVQDRERAAAVDQKDIDTRNLISRSLAEAEKNAIKFLSAAAKGTAGKEEEDTVGNDHLGLDED